MTATVRPGTTAIDDARESWTGREIAQQPRLWRALAASTSRDAAAHRTFLDPVLARGNLRIVLSGAGSSDFIGQMLAPALTGDLERRVEALATTDIVSNPRQAFAEDVPTLMVSFARSGDSPESVEAVRLADQLLTQVWHVVVTCSSEGALYREHSARESSLVLLMPDGSNDRGFAMTSSFSCMLLAASMLLRSAHGPAGPEELTERLASALEAALPALDARAAAVAGRGYRRVVYLGSGPLAGLARESALKLLELTAGQVGAWFDSSLGFRHGPKAVVDDATLVVVLRSGDDHVRRYDDDIAVELRGGGAGADVLVVTGGSSAPPDATDGAAHGAAHGAADGVDDAGTWRIDGLDGVDDTALAVVLLAAAQLIALHTSIALGLTPDDPFPSKEVNRVVRGVTIHPLES